MTALQGLYQADYNHPCQGITDVFTIWEKLGDLKGLKLAYVGDGNNVAVSLLFATTKLGMHFAIGNPPGYDLPADAMALGRQFAQESGSQIATSAGAGYDLYERQQGLFLFDGTPAGEHTVDELQQALLKQVRRLQDKPVEPDELQRVKSKVVADAIYELDSTFYQAMKIGQLEAAGLDWWLADEYVDRINAVTAEQVQAVARKYLVEEYLTVAVLDPLPMQTGKTTAALPGADHVH